MTEFEKQPQQVRSSKKKKVSKKIILQKDKSKPTHSRNTRNAKKLDSSQEFILPAVTPKTQTLELITYQSFTSELTKIIIQVPIVMLQAAEFTSSTLTRIQNTPILVTVSKESNEQIMCDIKVKGNVDQPSQDSFIYLIWGKYCWLSSFQIQNKVLKRIRKEVSESEATQFLSFKIKQFNSDLFIVLNMQAETQYSTDYCGLVNQGNTCYMNSYLQMLHHIPEFRNLIYSAQIKETQKFLPLFQNLFYRMQTEEKPVSPEDMIKSFGWSKKEMQIQQDAQEFSCLFFQVLEKTLSESCQNSSHMSLNELFQGQLKHYIQTQNSERFYDLQVGITDSLAKSLDEYVEEHLLTGDNKYMTDSFGLQDAKKGVTIERVPPVLMIQIKRFHYNHFTNSNEKMLNKFEYPQTLSLQKWTLDGGSDPYQLYGVLVHQGFKAESGHYYAYLKCDDKWYKFNDQLVQQVPKYRVLNYNFGGIIPTLEFQTRELRITQKMTQSKTTAYMLVYINSNMKPTLMNSVDAFPDWLLKHNQDKINLQKERKLRKLTYQNVPYLSWSANLLSMPCGIIGLLTGGTGECNVIDSIEKGQKVSKWIEGCGEKGAEQAVYAYGINAEKQILICLNSKINSLFGDAVKQIQDLVLLFTDKITLKQECFVVVKSYIIKDTEDYQCKIIDSFTIGKQQTQQELYKRLKKYQPEESISRFYMQGKKDNLPIELLESSTSLIPSRYPSRNQLLITIIESRPHILTAEMVQHVAFSACYKREMNTISVTIKNQQNKDIERVVQMDKNTSIQGLKNRIYSQFHEECPELKVVVLQHRQIVDNSGRKQIIQVGCQQWKANKAESEGRWKEHIILKSKSKRNSRVFTEIAKMNKVVELVKYDPVVLFSYCALNAEERNNIIQLAFRYRYRNGKFTPEQKVVVQRKSKANVFDHIIGHQMVQTCLEEEQCIHAWVLLFSKDLTLIKAVIDQSGTVLGKGDIRTLLTKQKNLIAVVQGHQQPLMSHELYILIHHVSNGGDRVGRPKCCKFSKLTKLIELKNNILDIISQEQYEWEGKQYTSNPFKVKMVLYNKDLSKGIHLEDIEEHIEEQEGDKMATKQNGINLEHVELKQNSNGGCTPNQLKEKSPEEEVDSISQKPFAQWAIEQLFTCPVLRLLITHTYLTKGILPMKLQVQ